MRAMPRRKIPDEERLETEGIGLPKQVIERLEEISLRWGVKRSAAGRELLLLGLAVYEAMHAGEVNIDRLADGEKERPAPAGRVISP